MPKMPHVLRTGLTWPVDSVRLWSAYTQKFIVRRTRTVLGARDFTVQSYGTLYPQISEFHQYLLQRLPNT